MRARSPDTDPDAEAVQVELLRQAGEARRARMALALSAQVIGLARRAIRRSLAGASEQEAALRFVELHYGPELAAGLRRHLAREGGAGGPESPPASVSGGDTSPPRKNR